jgi:DNA-directed RNA polymerase subunit RPC12/RpoP
MVKIHTTLSVDDALMKKAKEARLNISEAAAEGIKNRLNFKDVQIQTSYKCEFCKKEFPREDLVWLYPDEKWICSRCLKILSRRVPIGQK